MMSRQGDEQAPRDLERYVVRLERYLRECVESADTKRDACLWNARRCAEAIGLYLFEKAHKRPPKDAKEAALDQLIQQRDDGLISAEIRPTFLTIQHHGNRGVHVQPDDDVDMDDVSICLPALAKLVTWFFKQLKREMPPGIHAAVEQLRTRYQGAVDVSGRSSPVALQSPPRRRYWVGTAGGVLVLGTAIAAWPWRHGPHADRQRSPTADASTDGQAVAPRFTVGRDARDDAEVARAPDVAPVPAAVPPADAAGRARVEACPPETVAYAGTAHLRLGQPHPRPTWPPARGPVLPVAVPPFCLDRVPVSVAAYRRCVDAGHCRSPTVRGLLGCNWPGASRTRPMNCVAHDEAAAYCVWSRGALPDVVQWEWTTRDAGPASRTLQFPTGTVEWARDEFPAAIFQRGSTACTTERCQYMTRHENLDGRARSGHVSFSWNHADGTDRRPDLVFRCARPAGGAPAPAADASP